MTAKFLTQANHDAIAELLLGRKVEKVDDRTLLLDNGAKLTLRGNDGGCSCGAGDYQLTELNGIDNVITNVEFLDDPDTDDTDGEGYRIFVFAGNEKINLATFEGTDGNGYYGTGYSVEIEAPATEGIA